MTPLDAPRRGDRLDQFSFGQRTFGLMGESDRAAVAMALRAFDRYPMLMLTLERVGITAPAVYVAAARHARQLAAVDRRYGFAAVAQFQGVLAMVARLVRVHALDTSAAQALIGSLCAVPVSHNGYDGGLLQWIERELRPRLASADDVEGSIIARLAGVGGARAVEPVHVMWEGQSYHLDLAAAEERRLHLVREKQRGISLDVALDIADQARTLSAESVSAAALASGIAALNGDVSAIRARPQGDEEIVPAGVAAPRDPRVVLTVAIEDLVRNQKSPDARRVSRIVEPLVPVAEAIAGDALLSLAYAVDLGDPDGAVLLAGNVARRHDFGFGVNDADARARVPWTAPKQDVIPGAPWHVTGSALGLDVALASLTLRRVDAGRIGSAPMLTSNERQTFAASVALMSPVDLTDADRDAIAGAIARGRERIAAVTPATFDALADEIALDGWRRRAVKWSLLHDPAAAGTMFSLTELLSLGGVAVGSTLDAWGMGAVVTTGCLCTRLRAPGGWWNLTGRPQLGLLATTIADVNLRVAVLLADLKLPAAIARDVLTAAMQDYVDDVRPSDHDDWLTLVRAAQSISRDRVEDYVAAITAGGPLVPDGKGDGSRFARGPVRGAQKGDGSHFHPTAWEPQPVVVSAFVPSKRGQVSRFESFLWAAQKRLPSPFPS